ncbi:hypothetical protein AMR41_26195 [Hapalosiphon sp. MRB220]|nr:hypothetical protein AMR41_26195 [Hapalosiphon sp. MRB220]
MTTNKNLELISAKMIIRNLLELPSSAYWEIDLSPDQQNHWLAMRGKCNLQSQYWWSIFNFRGDPLTNLVESGQITEWDRLTVILQVDFFQRLWELVQTAEPHLKKIYEAGAYPWAEFGDLSAAALLSNIIKDFIDGEFEKALQPFFKLSIQDGQKICSYYLDEIKSPQGKREAKNLVKNFTKDKCLSVNFLLFCDYAAKTDPSVMMRINALQQSNENLFRHWKTALARKRSSKNFHKFASFRWQEGILKLGSSTGGTYA